MHASESYGLGNRPWTVHQWVRSVRALLTRKRGYSYHQLKAVLALNPLFLIEIATEVLFQQAGFFVKPE
jgi:hypothetical protein